LAKFHVKRQVHKEKMRSPHQPTTTHLSLRSRSITDLGRTIVPSSSSSFHAIVTSSLRTAASISTHVAAALIAVQISLPIRLTDTCWTYPIRNMKRVIGWLLWCCWIVPTTHAFTVTTKATTFLHRGHWLSPPERRVASTHHDLAPMTMKRPHCTGTVVFADATATAEASKETFEFTVRHLW
jgi:hypothetical protein